MTIRKQRPYINVPMLLRMIGWLLLIEAGFMLFPLIAAIVYSDSEISDFTISMGITAVVGFGLTHLRPRVRDMGKREAIMLTALTWIILSLFGMIPFLLSKTHLGITDAFFESMNGFTTTGGSVLTTVNDVSHSVLLWRSIQQWIGGMGIILFTLAIVPMLNNSGGIFLFNAEITGITHDKLRPRISSTAKGLWIVYISLTALLILLLSLSDMNMFEAICNGLSTMSTGGFSTSDSVLEGWDATYVKVVMIIFMTFGGINFALLYKAATGKFKDVAASTALKWYLIGIIIAYALLTLNLVLNHQSHSWSDLTIDPLFQAVSTISSTGISEPDFATWGSLATIILVIMMFSGACAGSTSGGAKIDRIIILFKFLKNEFFKMMNPSHVTSVSINGRGISSEMVKKVLAFLCLYVIVIFVGGTLLVLCGVNLRESFFYTLSSISNTGIGTDIVGIGHGFASLPDMAKWILAFVMLTGRLELYTVLLIFTPYFWEK